MEEKGADYPAPTMGGREEMLCETEMTQNDTNRTNNCAIWSFVIACTSYVLFFWIIIPDIAAIILGRMAKKQIRKSGEQGYALAAAGVVLGWVKIVLTVVVVGILIVAGMYYSYYGYY